jgi:hypothetical protein
MHAPILVENRLPDYRLDCMVRCDTRHAVIAQALPRSLPFHRSDDILAIGEDRRRAQRQAVSRELDESLLRPARPVGEEARLDLVEHEAPGFVGLEPVM